MQFSQAISEAAILQHAGPDVSVQRITHDSRQATAGAIFVAMRGQTSDANQYIPQAIAAGCEAIVTDSGDVFKSIAVTNTHMAIALCQHGRHALANIAATLSGHPEKQLKLAGVTGTNGKTTTTFLLEAMLAAASRSTLLLGTIEIHLDGKVLPASHTTPEADALFALLQDAASLGVSDAVMEVSSHALQQGRVWGLGYDVAVFTNLTRDHLDFHGTMEAYFAAKQRLFVAGGTGAAAPRVAVLNVDDDHGRLLADQLRTTVTEVVTYGLSEGDFHACDVEFSATGTRFTLHAPHDSIAIHTSLAGRVNMWNILAAAAAATARGVTLQQIAAAVAQLAGVPGRFQQVQSKSASDVQPFAVVVDYAHTDDALRNLTAMARELVRPNGGRVITLFGCGGDRDKSKRPLMAAAAAENSDVVFLTSDNPRSEDPAQILQDAAAGFAGGSQHTIIEDREVAIHAAIAAARAGDIVLLAGKGHEKTQTTRAGTRPFDDVAVAAAALENICS